MGYNHGFIALGALGLLRIVSAGFVPPAEFCLPEAHLKELSGCIAMVNKEDECAAKSDREKMLDCFCTQEMFLAYQDCQADVQLCLATHMFDFQFSQKIQTWHSLCDSRLPSTTTITSRAAMPTITSTLDLSACDRLYASCASADYLTNLCRDSYLPSSSSVDFVRCVCQPSVYRLMSECQYDGNVSCLRTTADERMILGHDICPYFWSGSETLPLTDITSWISASGDPNQILYTHGGDEARLSLRPAPHGTAVETVPTGDTQEEL